MTLTRDDIRTLLELRYEATKERWGDGTIDAWWEWLGDLDMPALRQRMRELVRGGATRIAPAQLAEGQAASRIRFDRTDGCDHTDRFDITETHSRCNQCRKDLYSANNPRIASQWERWVEEGRQSVRNQRAERGAA